MSLLCQSRMYRMSPRYGSTTIARQNIRPARTGLRVELQLVTDAPHPALHTPPALLAVMAALSTGLLAAPIVLPPSAQAIDCENTSGFERRQCELEKRREILRQAREKAEQPGGAAAPAVADAEDTADESDASSRRLELPRNLKATDLYEEQAAKALKAPVANPLESSPLNFSLPAMPEKLSDIKPPDLSNLAKDLSDLKDKGFSAFDLPEAPSAPSAPSAPAPAPPATTRIELPRYQAAQPTERRQILSTPDPAPPAAPAPPAPAIPSPAQPPAPTPLPTKVVEPASVKNAPQTAVTAKAGKRRGPLPLPVAQLLELGLMAGFVAAITKYNDQTTKVADAVWKVIVAAYTKLESLTAAKTA
ncbi:hypothetical protein V8C86DRAFT_3028088 [Haematococcus lacustris]